LRAKLITLRQLRRQPLFGRQYDAVRKRYPALALDDRRLVFEVIRRMIGTVVADLIESSQRNIRAAAPASIGDVRRAGRLLVALSADVHDEHVALKRFLDRHLYRHEKKLVMTARVQAVIRDLFVAFMRDNSLMRNEYSGKSEGLDEAGRARIVADYIAGMTDRFAFQTHERLAG
jgi:dGTPase